MITEGERSYVEYIDRTHGEAAAMASFSPEGRYQKLKRQMREETGVDPTYDKVDSTELKAEYIGWYQFHNRRPAGTRRCEVCDGVVEAGKQKWFLTPTNSNDRVVHTSCARKNAAPAGIAREKAEHVEPPTKRWDIASELAAESDPVATVGYGRVNVEGGPGIRLEMDSGLLSLEQHKARKIIAKNLHPEVAKRIGTALVEAGEQALAGQAPLTKRSNE